MGDVSHRTVAILAFDDMEVLDFAGPYEVFNVAGELGEERVAPAQDEEFVLSHSDNVQATGFVEHLKLPHYVDFQAELVLLRRLRGDAGSDDDRLEAAE